MTKQNGFTLIELLVVLAIIAVLTSIVLFSITKYINSGKDSSISGNLAVLVPAGEVYYNSNSSTYEDFCYSSVVLNAFAEMPENPTGNCYEEEGNPSGACCGASLDGSQWAACAAQFSGLRETAFCVDSRGIKRQIEKSLCIGGIVECK